MKYLWGREPLNRTVNERNRKQTKNEGRTDEKNEDGSSLWFPLRLDHTCAFCHIVTAQRHNEHACVGRCYLYIPSWSVRDAAVPHCCRFFSEHHIMSLHGAEESVDVFDYAIFFVVQLLPCLDTLKKDIFLLEVANSWCVRATWPSICCPVDTEELSERIEPCEVVGPACEKHYGEGTGYSWLRIFCTRYL
jgi:hypothetical protein